MNNGQVIAGWRTLPLCEAAEVIMGSSPPGESYNENAQGMPLINGPVEFGEGDFGLTIRRQYTTEPTKLCRAGDLLLCVRRSSTGRTNIAGFDACIGRGVAAIRAKEHQPFLNHFIRTQRQRLFDLGNGSTFPSITQDQLAEVKVPLPPLPDQRRIATILDKADAIRRKREEGIRLSEELLRSTFLEMFGDPATNPKGWNYATLAEVCSKLSDGPFGSNLKSEHYTDQGVRVIRLQNIGSGEWLDDNKAFISKDHFHSLPRHHCEPGDVLIGTLGDPNVRACILPEHVGSALNKTDCIQARVDLSKLLAEVLCAYLNTPGALGLVSKMLHGQTRVRVSMGQLKDLPVYLPPISLQRDFQGIYAKALHMRTNRVQSLFSSEVLFSSLTQRAFRGEL